jgi:hypothetical protein
MVYIFEIFKTQKENKIILLYTMDEKGAFHFRDKNENDLLFLLHTSFNDYKGDGFILEQIGRRNYNKFYCYIQYDSILKGWFLVKDEVIEDVGKFKIDPKTKNIIETVRKKTILRSTIYNDDLSPNLGQSKLENRAGILFLFHAHSDFIRGLISQRTMRPEAVVFLPPSLDLFLGIIQR